MSNAQVERTQVVKIAALATPLFGAISLATVALIIVLYKYDIVGHALCAWFNPKSDKFYSASFTFLAAFWGASLTVWALLKSRATRYIEKLHDNVVFCRFVRQYERRLLYALTMLIASFALYVQDVKIGSGLDTPTLIAMVWFTAYMCIVFSLIDVISTARSVL